jgi:hypothetical protein
MRPHPLEQPQPALRPGGLAVHATSSLRLYRPNRRSPTVDSREQIQVMSGGSAEFKSDDVLSYVTYQVLPNSQAQQGQVVSSITGRILADCGA